MRLSLGDKETFVFPQNSVLTHNSSEIGNISEMLLTVMLLPDVMATQSSWLKTVELESKQLVQVERSKPSLLWAAGSPPYYHTVRNSLWNYDNRGLEHTDLLFGASPALLSRKILLIVMSDELEIEKQCVGQF